MLQKKKIPNIIHNIKNKITGAIILGSVWLSNSIAKAQVDTDFLLQDNGNGMFSELEETAKATGASFYRLILTIGVIGLVISLLLCGMTIAFFKNASKREEGKSQLFWIVIGAVVVFGALSIVGYLKTMGASL